MSTKPLLSDNDRSRNYHASNSVQRNPSYLEKLPSVLLTKIAQYLPGEESWILANRLSKSISIAFNCERDLRAAWERNPIVRQVYEKYLRPDFKWTDLKKILQHDLKLAKRMAGYNREYLQLPNDRYLKKGMPLFDKFFYEFEQISYIVFRDRFFDMSHSCCCLNQWEWSIPLRNGSFCTPCDIAKWSLCSNISSSLLGCLTCCLPIPTYLIWINMSLSTTAPSLYAYARKEDRKSFLQGLERFKAIKALDFREKLRTMLLAPPSLPTDEPINRGQFIQYLIEVTETVERIKNSGRIPALEKLCDQIKKPPRNVSKMANIDDLGLLNRARFIGNQALNRNIGSPLSNEEKLLIGNFLDLEIYQIQSQLMKSLSNVNHPEFKPMILNAKLDLKVLALLVDAGLEVESIPVYQITPLVLSRLLDAGIFVNHPVILEKLSGGYRYDLAVILFLYGYDHYQIDNQVRHQAFLKVTPLKEIQLKVRADLPECSSVKGRSLLFRRTLEVALGTQNIGEFCDQLVTAKNQLEGRLRHQAAVDAVAAAAARRIDRSDRMRP